MAAAWWKNILVFWGFFSDYAAALGVSPLHKKSVSQLEKDNAAKTQLCFWSWNTQSTSQYLMTAHDN